MKVYTKKDYSDNDLCDYIAAGIILFGAPIVISIIYCFSEVYDFNILDCLFIAGPMLLLICLFFIIIAIASREKNKVTLKEKKEEEYFNQKITNMLFISDNNEHDEYYCYSIGQNNLTINEEYNIKTKNGDVYSIDTNDIDKKDSRKKAKKLKKEETKYIRMLKKTRAKSSVLTVLLTTIIIFSSIFISIIKIFLNANSNLMDVEYFPMCLIILFPTIFLDRIIFSIRKYLLFKKHYNIGIDANCIKFEKIELYDSEVKTIYYCPKWEYKYNGKVHQVDGSNYKKKEEVENYKYFYINPNLVDTGDELFDLQKEKSKLSNVIICNLLILFVILLIGVIVYQLI